MNNHTPGKVTQNGNNGIHAGMTCVALTHNGEHRKADAERIAVLWNAFEGVPTEDVREGRELIDRNIRQYERLQRAEREAAKMAAALREAKQQIEYLHEKFGATGSGNQVLARISAALESFDTQ